MNGNGALDDYVTIVAPEGTTLTNVRALKVPSDNPPPDGVRLPYGLFDYDVTVASPGDTADVTYVLPDEGVAPTSVHMLQNGVWTDYADHTSVDSVDGKVTVAFRDGGEGDDDGCDRRRDQGPVRSVDEQSDDHGHEHLGRGGAELHLPARALQRDERNHVALARPRSARRAARPTPPATAPRSAMVRRGSGGARTALEYDRNYRLSVITPLPASGWGLTARNCNPDGSSTTNSGTTAIVMRLSNSTGNQRAACTFTFAVVSGTITVHKGGTRANPAGTDNGTNYAAGLQGAVFESSPQNANTWSDLCTTDAAGDCTSAVLSPGTYDVREKSTPSGWSTIPSLVFGGNSSGTGNQTHPYVGTATVGSTGSGERLGAAHEHREPTGCEPPVHQRP